MGVDLITIFNFVMDAGCNDSIVCINSDADYPETKFEELMKCSCQFGSKLDQSKTCKLNEIGTHAGEVRFSSAFHSRSQVVQIQKGYER